MNFNEKLISLRKSKGLSQEELVLGVIKVSFSSQSMTAIVSPTRFLIVVPLEWTE